MISCKLKYLSMKFKNISFEPQIKTIWFHISSGHRDGNQGISSTLILRLFQGYLKHFKTTAQ